MKLLPILIVLGFITFAKAQEKRLTIAIDSIKVDKNIADDIKYEVYYHLKNNCNEKIRFYFDPKGFGFSLSNRKIYKFYQDKKPFEGLDFLNIITKKEALEFENKILNRSINLDLINDFKDSLSLENFYADLLKKDLMELKPLETKKLMQIMYWQNNRYYKQGDNEYYLSENSFYELEFTLILLKEPLKSKMKEEEFLKMMQDKYFVSGVFVSNKKQILFE